MKTIGLIGGLSWESTATYYRLINEMVNEQKGDLHSAKCLIHSFDFQDIATLQQQGKWDEASEKMLTAAIKLERAGADFLVICSNTMHKVADEIEEHLEIPLLHIADATADLMKKKGLSNIGLIGTSFTMEHPFYIDRLEKQGFSVIIPEKEKRQKVHDVIFDELCKGKINESSKRAYIDIIYELQQAGAEGVILGCTEISLLIQQNDVDIPLFDTTKIHAKAAVSFALKD
ncbi:aspartate/glutamate racemase family protein [Salipaludibacillus daqingensis]|uniref:aspartate/glutamate racemase family protein n=1 Tax=Salipaludibacillus daqingensis TaxID=3041001 RepID=UPI00247515C0|nr:aspartate/glutamate racemase family protein [Salipaludibacillus daqingensis]